MDSKGVLKLERMCGLAAMFLFCKEIRDGYVNRFVSNHGRGVCFIARISMKNEFNFVEFFNERSTVSIDHLCSSNRFHFF